MALIKPASGRLRRSVFDLLPDGIVIVELDGRIAYVNEQLSALSGYTAKVEEEANSGPS